MAYYDALTALPNRAGFEKSFNKSLMLAKNVHNMALLFIDLDDFKKINDTLGHSVGDQVLITLSQIIKVNIREVDILARWGGEEFVIISPQIELHDAYNMAERLRKTIYKIGV